MRRASSELSFKRELSKKAYDQKATRKIVGQIGEIIIPQFEDNYDGYFVGSIGGYRVVGNLPFIDKNFIFHLICLFETSKRYGCGQWRIVDFDKPAFEPVPLTFFLLKRLAISEGGLSEFEASVQVRELKEAVEEGIPDVNNINPEQLIALAFPMPMWLAELADNCMLFKFPALKNLTFYWKPEALAKLKVEELVALSEMVNVDIARFCFRMTTMFGLPDVEYENAKMYYIFQGKLEPSWLFRVWLIYTNFKAHIRDSKRISVDPSLIFQDWKVGKGMPEALQRNVVKVVSLKLAERPISRIVLEDDARKLQYVAHRLNMIMAKAADCITTIKSAARISLQGLNEEQKAAVEAIKNTNLLVVTGVGGTGKTQVVGYKILQLYGKKRTMPLAFCGSIASDLRKQFGKGMTVHKLDVEVERENIDPERIEVVIADEFSTWTLDLLWMMLRRLPELKKLVIIGDVRQMSPPSAGPVFNDFLSRYTGTPIVQNLTQIMRVEGDDETAQLHREILNKLYDHDYNVPYSTDLNSNCPFIIHPRVEAIPDRNGRVTPEAEYSAAKQSLEPIFRHYHGNTVFQTVAQKNETVDVCNQALYEFLFVGRGAYNKHSLLIGEKIILLENNYITYTPSDAKLNEPHYDKTKDKDYVLRTDEVSNGESVVIEAIFDVHINNLTEKAVQDTGHKSKGKNYNRVVRFTNGKQVNLRHYGVHNLKRGEAITVFKSQGLQYPVVVVFIHKDFTRTLNIKQLVTAIGRGKRRFVIICARPEGSLEDSEIGTILKTPEPPIEPLLALLLNPYRPPWFQGAQAPVQNGEEFDLF